MANIPVERSGSGLPWWAWLLGALLLLSLLFAVTQCNNEDDTVVMNEEETTVIDDDPVTTGDDPSFAGDTAGITDPLPADATGAAGTTGTIATLDELYDGGTAGTAGTADTRVGRTVNVSDAPVLSVVGDSSFYVGLDDNRRVLVVLSGLGESESGAGPPEGDDGRLDINVGDRVSISGTVARFDRNMRGTTGLAAADRERLLNNGLAVVVNSLADIRATEGSIRTDN